MYRYLITFRRFKKNCNCKAKERGRWYCLYVNIKIGDSVPKCTERNCPVLNICTITVKDQLPSG